MSNAELISGLAGLDITDPAERSYPRQVPGRTAHIDADFIAYQISAESKDELDPDHPKQRKTLQEMKANAENSLDHIRKSAGATHAVCHVTTDPTKGRRVQFATLKAYQCSRSDREGKPEHLDTIRRFIGSISTDTLKGLNHNDQEADDGMAQALYADEKAILCSADKDLLMVPGKKLDMQSYSIWEVSRDDPFGKIELVRKIKKDGKPGPAKLKGYGTAFFWAQLLMGDPADDIVGLPECPGEVWQRVAGTKKYNELREKWIAEEDNEKAKAIRAKLTDLERKTKLCGPALTYNILRGVRSDEEAFRVVRDCYVRLQTDHGYTYSHWNTRKAVTPKTALASNMLLLWMRRTKNDKDVLVWMKEKLAEWDARR